tara:strand:- start:4215 stop:4637 length:423 start_codon:yes stop_codon:yes gene_type:complete
MVMTPGKGVGLRNVGSYQISGHPYVTGSTLTDGQEMLISFPTVTKSITVVASGSSQGTPLIGITFNSTSSTAEIMTGRHTMTMNSSSQSLTFDVKCREIYVHAKEGSTTSGFELYASLTGVPATRMYALTGSGLTTADGT